MSIKHYKIIFPLILFGQIYFSFSQKLDSIRIGGQVWSKKNLNVSFFRNGDTIPEAKTKEQWIKAGKERKAAWCYYDNNPQNGKLYGKLYNWYAFIDSRSLAPVGWRIPYAEDFAKLAHYHNLIQEMMKSKTGWMKAGNPKIKLYDGNGSNSYGFNAMPAGFRGVDGIFGWIRYYTGYWSITTKNDSTAWNLNLCSSNNGPDLSTYQPNAIGLSVRLVIDDGLRDSNRVNNLLRPKIDTLIIQNKFDSARIFISRLYNSNGFVYYDDFVHAIKTCLVLNNPACAESYFLKSIDKINDEEKYLYNHFGWSLILSRFYSLALKYLDEATQKFPEDQYIKCNLAHAYLLSGDIAIADSIYLENIFEVKYYGDEWGQFGYDDYSNWLEMVTKDFAEFKSRGILSDQYDRIIQLVKDKIIERMGYDVFEEEKETIED